MSGTSIVGYIGLAVLISLPLFSLADKFPRCKKKKDE